ncbi:MAG: sigma-54-dependent Fis family transcriptional regulator [Nitrospirae bacterium]|nr:MAG: sigma-54-dependent Fis family transcriptional regulator [Nitrospirota bacterium]
MLVVEDDASAREACRILLEDAGYRVEVAGGGEEAVQWLERAGGQVDLVLTDLRMPGMSGLDLLEAVQRCHPQLPVAMMTAHGSSRQEQEAYARGVRAFIPKPFTEEELLAAVEQALDRRRLEEENRELRRRLEAEAAPHGIVGTSEAIQAVIARIHKAAAADCTVLVTGESGTGKELVARAIHRASRRQGGPFVALNCGAVPENLLESQLFGYLRGAFTGADRDHQGLLAAAEGGTLFLDEIGDLAPALQVKLLRVLQEREYTPLGGHTPVRTDVRVIAATHRNLRELVAAGRFREDLYYRLDILPIHLPPLRERASDIPLLVDHFLQEARREVGNPNLRLAPGALARMVGHPWPGNVRELANAITRAAVLADGDEIDPVPAGRPSLTELLPEDALPEERPPTLAEVLAEAEKAYLVEVLERCEGNQVRAAKILGISRRTLYNKIQHHGIRKQFRAE